MKHNDYYNIKIILASRRTKVVAGSFRITVFWAYVKHLDGMAKVYRDVVSGKKFNKHEHGLP